MLNKMNIAGQDDRIKKYLLPKKIIWKKGIVENCDSLFLKKSNQITTDEPDCLIMQNKEDGEKAAVLIDFGVEYSGGIRILTHICEGLKTPQFRLSFGESANEAISNIGEKNATNDHAIRDMNILLTNFSDMEFGQTASRFAYLELQDKNVKVRIKSILGVFVYRDLEYKGSFSCSDDVLNEIYNVCAYTCHLNMQSMLWDGVKRDRLVWIGDMHPEMLTVKTVFGYDRCIEEGLEFAIEQCPLPDYANHMVTYSMWWLLIVHDWYFYSRKSDFILRNKHYIKTLLLQLCSLIDDNGEDHLNQYATGYFLDWQNFYKEEAKAGVLALFSMSLKAGAEICRHITEKETEELCMKKAESLKKRIPEKYKVKASTALMALADFIDVEKAADEVLLPGGSKDMSTFMSYYILTALTKAGRTEEALKILKEYYGGMLTCGATTFWEHFDISWFKDGASIERLSLNGEYDIHGDNGDHCYIGYRHSLCHGWSSAPAAFLAEQVLGIEILEPGCSKIRITPKLGFLEWAKGSYPTPYGILKVSHKKDINGNISSELDIPEGIIVEGRA